MGNNDTLRNLLIAGGIFAAVLLIAPRLLPPRPTEPAPGSSTLSEQQGGEFDTAPFGKPEGAPTTATTIGSPKHGDGEAAEKSFDGTGFAVQEAAVEETRLIGSEAFSTDRHNQDSPFRMQLTLTNRGAAVASALMTDHKEKVDTTDRYELLSTIERPDGARYYSLAVEKINIDNVDISLLDKLWHVEPIDSAQGDRQSVSFWLEIEKDGIPTVRLRRTFSLTSQTVDSGLHDLGVDLTVDNLTNESHRVIVSYRGGLVTKQANPRMDDRYVHWGLASGGYVAGDGKGYAAVAALAGKDELLYKPSPATPDTRISWAATANTYFTCTVAPLNRRDSTLPEEHIASVSAFDVDGSSFTVDDTTLRFVSRQETLQVGGSLRYPADVYLGDKDGKSFRVVDRYVARNYYYQIAQGFGWCTFTWLVELMIWLLNALFPVFRDFGAAIIVMVMLVRTLLHPITKKGQVNMVRMQQKMQDMQPKIEEIKKKYSNDKARMNQEMMKLNINPAGQMITCIPMVIQMPIWVALYMSLSNNILMRHEPAFWGLTWIKDLTEPDALYTFASPIHVPLVGWELPALNLLPFFLAISMYVQQKLQPKPKPNPNATEQQRAQQEMMQKMGPIMSIMMLVIFFKMPSGLNLYIMTSSIFGAIEQWRIRLHINEREAAGTLHKPAPKPRALPGGASGAQGGRTKPSFIQRLQRAAEEAQRVKSQSGKKRGKGRS